MDSQLRKSNIGVSPGGRARHDVTEAFANLASSRLKVVSLSPIRDDLPDEFKGRWHPVKPGTDTAIMLALAQVLWTEGLADRDFLDRYTVGADRFVAYLTGADDNTVKDPEWAEAISGVPADEIRALARNMAAHRTMITVAWSLQRADHGEQPVWAAIALAAMVGQIGLPGGGFGHGHGSMGDIGGGRSPISFPSLPQGRNAVEAFIPVARVADMLLSPGEAFEYNGQSLTYPDIRLVYWSGGNPFHHHQDLNRLREAFTRPETVIVHEPYWTATARNADIVLPVAPALERNDIGAGRGDNAMVAMKQALAPMGQSRSDFDIFAELSERVGSRSEFTEGRTAQDWIEHLYEGWRSGLAEPVPAFEEFWQQGTLDIPGWKNEHVLLSDFRTDPEGFPLATPSGRIEIFSEKVAGFGYDDCPGYPCWREPRGWTAEHLGGQFPFTLIANQPSTRLHSQLDMGDESQGNKIEGREPIRIHPEDAALRSIADGQIVRVWNHAGSCLAGARLSDSLARGVVQLSTGAWFDPSSGAASCVHGNPNVLTSDRGTSRLAQGCTGQYTQVQIEPYEGELPAVRAFEPPL